MESNTSALWPRRLAIGLAIIATFVLFSLLLGAPTTARESANPRALPPCASNSHSGTIVAPERWCAADNPHLVTGDVIVQTGGVLTIEAGVEVRFNAGFGLRMSDGPLFVQGTVTQPVLFTANSVSPARGFWTGLSWDSDEPPENTKVSTVTHCVVEYAMTAVYLADTDNHTISHCTLRYSGSPTSRSPGGAINSAGDGLTITYNEVYSNELGMRLTKAFGYELSGNHVYDNEGYGIGFIAAGSPGGGNGHIANNEIHDNAGFGLGFVPQGIYGGGSDNEILDNDIYDNVAAGLYGGDGLYLGRGSNNVVAGNQVYGNEGHGVWADAQTGLEFTGNVVRGNGLNGLSYGSANGIPTALYSNVLCNNSRFDMESFWSGTLPAEGNWFGTNSPALGVEVSGTVDIDPWITMAVSLAPDTLPADGTSTASLALTMTNGTYAVPDGYTVDVSASEGSVAPALLALSGGQATATYTAGTVPGAVTFGASDQCTTLDFVGELTLQEVDLAVFKAGPGGTVAPGDVVAYTVTISELNGVDARDLLLTDLLPVGTSWVSDTAAVCGLSRQTTAPDVTWTSDLWSGGTSCTFSLQVLVGGDACQSQRLENTVSVSSAATDGNLANNTWTTGDDSPGIICLDLAVSKTDGGLIVGPNKEYFIEYTVTVSNVGVVTATGVVVTDTLPAEATYTGSDWACAGGVCSHAVGSLPLSATVELTLPVQLDKASLTCPVVLTNVVRVADSSGLDMNPADNVFTRTTTFDCLPDLVVVVNDNVGVTADEAKAPDSAWVLGLLGQLPEAEIEADCVYPGEWITYIIAYVNTGLVTATQVVLTETVPEYTSYVGTGWSCAGTTCTRSIGTLPPSIGGVAHFTVRVDMAPPDLTVEDEVRIGGAEEDLYPPDNVSSDDTPICAGLVLYISKDDNTPCAFPGDEIHYTIVVTNPSGETARGMVLTETLPAHSSYLTSAGWVPLGGGQFAYAVGDLAPFANVTATFAIIVDDPLPDTVTELVNVVCFGYEGPTPPGNCYTLVTPLPLEPDLRVVKHDHVGPPPPLDTQRELDRMYRQLFGEPYRPPATVQQWEPIKPGDIYSYTITYLNLGRRPATGVVLTETLPEHTSYVGYGWTHLGGRTYVYSVGDLAPGTGGQRNFYVQAGAVPCNGDEYLYNWVRIGGAEDECNLANNWSGEETPVECQTFVGRVYLPLIMKAYSAPAAPTPTPSPTPTFTPTPTPSPTPEAAYVSDVAVNAETNRVYVASPQLDAVFAVDPSGPGSVIATIPVGDHPLGLAVVTTTNKIYAANLNSWTVTAIRGADNARLADVYVGAQACKVAADSGDARVYATNHLESDNGAAAIDSHTDTFVYYYSRLHATQGRYGIDVDPEAEKLFIAARDAGLIAIQDAFLPDQEPQVFKLEPPRVPYVVAWNPTTGHLFVTAADDNGLQSLVVVLDPYSIQWNKGKWLLWRGRWVFELDRANAGWIKEIGVGAGAEEGIAVNPLTGYVYVTNADSDTVSILRDAADPANIQWVKDVAVGEYPQGVDVDVKTNTIYVGNAESRDLSVIDGATQTVVKTIPLE
jgi:uncharacterized repeat protein (TIGR01451 family)